jgi:hypothetical protein
MKAYEDAEKLAQEAQLAEIDRVKKQHAEAQERIKHYQQELVTAQVMLAAQKKGIIDPEMAAMAVHAHLEFGDDGMPNNLDKALDTLIKNKPYLAPKPDTPPAAPATPAQTANAQTAPTVPPFNVNGRASIGQPGQQPSGTPTRLEDLHWSR